MTPAVIACSDCDGRGGVLQGETWSRCFRCSGTGRDIVTGATNAHDLADELVCVVAEDREAQPGYQLATDVHDTLVLAAELLRDLASARSALLLARKERDNAVTAAKLNGETLRALHDEVRTLRGELARASNRQLKAVRNG